LENIYLRKLDCFVILANWSLTAFLYELYYWTFEYIARYVSEAFTSLSYFPMDVYLLYPICHQEFACLIIFAMSGLSTLSCLPWEVPWEVWMLNNICMRCLSTLLCLPWEVCLLYDICNERFVYLIMFAMRGLATLS
jgi:hypothetical protein